MRSRSGDDLDACEAIGRVVQERDGYPPHPPRELRGFIAGRTTLGAWVAEVDGAVVGHVALRPTTSDEAMAMAVAATGDPAERLGVVSRLFVAPDCRGRGAGGALLSAATIGCVERGLRPILDVATHFAPAIALYERHGWTRVGEVTVPFRDLALREYVYVGPAAPDADAGAGEQQPSG